MPIEGTAIRRRREFIGQPSSPWRPVDFREVWEYKELLYFFVWRDLKIRFKQTILGLAWVVLRPLFSVVIFTAVFGRWAKIPSEDLPYPAFILAGLLPWNFFASGVTQATGSLVANAHLVSKVYFPRLFVPLSAVVSAVVEALVSLVLLLILIAAYGRVPAIGAIVWVPFLLFLAMIISLGVSLWLAALNVKYRDVGAGVPFLVQIWMYATPVVYPLSLVPYPFSWLSSLNPMTGVVEGFRSALFKSPWPDVPFSCSVIVGSALFASSLFFFRRCERTLADSV